MKKRQIEMLEYVLTDSNPAFEMVRAKLGISKRTLYYDIDDINRAIKAAGHIEVSRGSIRFRGNSTLLNSIISNSKETSLFDMDKRRKYVLYAILTDTKDLLQKEFETQGLSKSLYKAELSWARNFLKSHGITIDPAGVSGKEELIRNLFINLSQEVGVTARVSSNVTEFDKRNKLQLTQKSLEQFDRFLSFMKERIQKGFLISFETIPYQNDELTSEIALLINTDNPSEIAYTTAFLSTLTSNNVHVTNELVERYMDELIKLFEKNTANLISDPFDFKQYLRPHLVALYNRLLFDFPDTIELTAFELGMDTDPLFNILKNIMRELSDLYPAFANVKQQEICYIAAYFGAYLQNQSSKLNKQKRVLIVCPHGLVISKTIQMELLAKIPGIVIAGCSSPNNIHLHEGTIDLIVSTILLDEVELSAPVIYVHPTPLDYEIQEIMSRVFEINSLIDSEHVNSLIQIIAQSAEIANQSKLEHDIKMFLHSFNVTKKERAPMLKELLTSEKVLCNVTAQTWEEAIEAAAQPLIADGSIETSYIESMIESVCKHGPYIVLADYFALPHAQAGVGVNRLGMSLIQLNESVDLMGNPVKTFLVLAAVDSKMHLNALSELTELLSNDKHLQTFLNGSKEEIIALVHE